MDALTGNGNMRVIVIGSGIAGLSVAIAMRRAGVNITVYERAAALTEIGAGISLWSNALAALKALGAFASVEPKMQSARTTEFRFAEGHRVAASFDATQLEAATGLSPVVAMIHGPIWLKPSRAACRLA